MITAYGPLDNSGLSKSFKVNVKALSIFHDVLVNPKIEDSDHNILYVHEPEDKLVKISKTAEFKSFDHKIAYHICHTEHIAKSTLAALKKFTRVWTPSRYSAKILSNAGCVVEIIPHAVTNFSFRPRENKVFKFLLIFDPASRILRKNPFAAIKAFSEAFGDSKNVQLTIKTKNLSESYVRALKNHGPSSNISLLNLDILDEEMQQLYCEHDALISLSQSSGSSLSAIEAMANGMPVVYTNHAALTEFVIGYPVKHKLKSSLDDVYEKALVAYPDPVDAAETLKLVPSSCRRLRSVAFSQSLNYTFSNLVKAISNVYPNL
jgi:glycosyltransferase involved in cell wall biosynthesis